MSNRYIEPGKSIGIIGGGQLGKMMALSAKEAGFRVVILEPTANSPAGQVADEEIIAHYHDRTALAQLADKTDVITYEFENIDYEALVELTKIAYVPQGAELIKITQDRILEKAALTNAGVTVAPYRVIYSQTDLHAAIEEIGYPSVLKTSRGGYDGKGQYVVKTESDLEMAEELLLVGPCVLEAWVAFQKEISVVMTRGIDGDISFFPTGENIHVNNILHQTIVPARVDQIVEIQVIELANKIAEHLSLVGTLAVEMFLTEDNQIYVNELAPRPHNSGHYTIEACNLSQFDQHIRAVCGWPLRQVQLLSSAVMTNVLGQHLPMLLQEIPNQPSWSIHLYGKQEAKHNRKMGHMTILTEEIDQVLSELDRYF